MLGTLVVVCLPLWLAGCATPTAERLPPPAGAPDAVRIWVVSHGWHTGIVVPRAHALPALAGEFPDAAYLEIGWGDEGFYTAPDQDIGPALALEAAFASRGAVLHVVALPVEPARYFMASEVAPLRLSAAGLRAMLAAIDADFVRDAQGAAQPLGRGLYGDSRFFRAHGRFGLWRTCNTWTAERLRAGGCPVGGALTAASVMAQVRQRCQP